MTIATAIAALSPSIWLKLDETSGTTAANGGSRTDVGTYSGSYQQGMPGPETGTFATRLFSGGQIQLGPMDISGFPDQTLACWVSMDASGTVNTNYPIVTIGDTANRLNRGPQLVENHTAIGGVRYLGRYSTQNGASVIPADPNHGWHFLVVTFHNASQSMITYIDGVAPAGITPLGTNPLIGDPLLIRCDEPCVIAHVCWFGGVLTQTQIQTVSGQLAQWPYTLPINTPPDLSGGGGGGGLTTDQAAQLARVDTNTDTGGAIQTDLNTLLSNWAGYTGVTLPSLNSLLNAIHTDTQNIVNTLFPALETPLNYIQDTVTNILNGITTTISNAAGSVGQTLGDFFAQHSHDEFGVFNVTSGPTCARIYYTVPEKAYWGLSVNITSWPAEWTFTTPDDGWSIRDLAVLTIDLAGEQQVRHGIHTKTFTLNPLPSVLPLAVAGIGVPVVPANYHVTVDWAGGVCGELLLYYLPVT